MIQRESTKFEARSSKQIQNDEKQINYNAPNGKDRIHRFGFSDFEFILAPVCFGPRGGFRASDFEFSFAGTRPLKFNSVTVRLQRETQNSFRFRDL
jgi:hypothetical protein